PECWLSTLVPSQMNKFYADVTNRAYHKLFVEFNYESVTYKLAFDIDANIYLPASYIWLNNDPVPLGTPLICMWDCKTPDFDCSDIGCASYWKHSCKGKTNNVCKDMVPFEEKYRKEREARIHPPSLITEHTADVLIFAAGLMLNAMMIKGPLPASTSFN
ncbi:MAG: hypothetical protein AAB968_02025, partial [Patescibacteria group bacterium]